MMEPDESSSVYMDESFKPPDRSTSAPPVLSLQSESLFAFRAAEHLHLFSDIRCEDNYYEFYKKYGDQNKLPPPLQTQPYIVDRSFVRPDEEDHAHGHHNHAQPPPAYLHPHFSVPTEARNVPPARSSSNPQYARQNIFDPYDPSRLDDIPADSPTNNEIWTPLYRKIANVVLEDEEKQQDKRGMSMPIPHQRRDPYYTNDFDAAYSTANQLLKDDHNSNSNNHIQSLWSDRAFDRQNYRSHNQPISTPTPIAPQTSSLLSLLSNGRNHNHNEQQSGGFFPEVSSSPIDAIGLAPKPSHHQRRASSGDRINILPTAPASTTPPLPAGRDNPNSTSPNLPTCRYFAQGYCSRGERCNYIHEGDQALTQVPAPVAALPPMPTPMPTSPAPSALPSVIERSLNNTRPKKGTPSPPPVGIISSLGNTLAPVPMHIVEPAITKKAPAVRSPVSSRAPGGPVEITFPNGQSSSPAPTPLSPNALASPSKADLTRQYTTIEQVVGHIYSLCKDQHGCRFLQKKLEDREPNVAEYIFAEVYDHMTELMTDPFGNYLCQKLLEHCDDSQRLEVIQRVSGDLVKISKNMHGTRAVQKMIEFLTTPAQIALVKKALANHVVTLIQDLNGNHVIQRCLNKLSPQDNQFIYDSVSQAGHCVEVATHRHGCCVLQRCIDHASDSQKMQLINEVIANALVLVQDPYGNYVVQYVLDLAFPGLASELARRFLGHIPILSTQKFSSNVIEKCLNVADVSTRACVIQELIEYDNLLYLLQDPYANYVIQTSLNVSEPMQHAKLVEAIRPHLTSLRNTPYGKRIQNKILKESSRDYYS